MLQTSPMKALGLFALMALCPLFATANPIHVILDPGHGGTEEPKKEQAGFDEKTVNLILAKKIQTQIETDDHFEVVLTRIGDYPLAFAERRKIANQYSSSIFISIHSSHYDKDPSVVTYLMKQSPAKTATILTPIESIPVKSYNLSIKLAQTFEEEFPEHVDHEIRMTKFPLASLVGIQSGAVLIECQCVAQNQSTADDSVLDSIARAISDGVQSFSRKVSL